MLIGMGTVFIFLTLLVGATRVMSAIALRLQPVAVPVAANAGAADKKVVAAIAAALELHRSESRGSDD